MKIKVALILFFCCISLTWGNGFLLQENKGQLPEKVLFKAPLNYGAIFIEKNKLIFVLHDKRQLDDLKEQLHHHEKPSKQSANHRVHSAIDASENNLLFNSHAFSISFKNANVNSTTTASNAVKHYYNYFTGASPSQWASGVKAYRDLWIRNLYTGIDFHLYGKDENLKYDFIIAPGANPDDIQLLYQGVDALELLDNEVNIITSVGNLTDESPYSFEKNQEHKINTSYLLNGQTISFDVDDYNADDTLVLDPVLNFGTFSGSTIDNWGFTATYDNNENAFGAGITFGTGYPITLGSFQSSFAGGADGGFPIDITISKFSADGSELLYSTYLGGSKQEAPHSLVVTPNNELLVFGTTSSTDFPTTTGAYDRSFNGGDTKLVDNVLVFEGTDIVVTKFSADGSSLIGSTYFGGTKNDGFNDEDYLYGLYHNYSDIFRGEIITDSDGNAIVATTTSSADLPIIGGFQNTFGGGSHDGCLLKFSPDLSQVIWSSYLGGSNTDAVFAVQANSNGQLYVTGGTTSADLPTPGNGIQKTLGGGVDGFVAQINLSGDELMNASFIGSNEYDQGYFVQVDEQDNVYVLGQTEGDLPISTGAYNNPNSGLFLQKYSSDLSLLSASTVVGNSSGGTDIVPSAFLVDNCQKIYISGWAGGTNAPYSQGNSFNLPITPDAAQLTTDGSDFYLMVLESNFSDLNYSSYFGSSIIQEHVDGGTSRFNKSGTVYQAVCASCGSATSFPVTPGAYAETMTSPNCNMAVFKFDASKLTARINPISDTLVCENDTIHFYNQSNGGTLVNWIFHDGTSSNLDTVWKIFDTPGEYEVMLVIEDPAVCPGFDTTTMKFRVKEIIVPTINAADTVICQGNATTIVMSDTANYVWYTENLKFTPFQNSFTHIPDSNTTLLITRQEICTDTLSIPVKVNYYPVPDTFSANLCPMDTAIFPVPIGEDYVYSWTPLNNVSMSNDSIYFSPHDTTVYSLTIDGNCGSAVVQYEVNSTTFNPLTSSDTTVCNGDTLTINTSDGDSYSWNPTSKIIGSAANDSISFVADESTVFTVSITKNSCSTVDSVIVNVLNEFPSSATYNLPLCQGDTVKLPYQENPIFNYTWNSTENYTIGNDSISFFPSDSVNYQLFIEGYCGTAWVNYNLGVTTITPITLADTTICFGDSLTLLASGADSYSWEPAVNGTQTTGNAPVFVGDDSTLFTVTLFKNQCAVNEQIQVNVNPPGPIPENHLDSLCENESVGYPVQSQNDFSTSWNTTLGMTLRNDSVFFAPSQSTLYELTITGLCGVETIPFDIHLTNYATQASPDTVVCLGESIPLFASGGDTAIWTPLVNGSSGPGFTQEFTGDTSTTFTVDLIKNNCVKQEVINVTVLPARPLGGNFTDAVCEQETAVMPFQTQSDFSYSWQPSNGIQIINDSVYFSPETSTRYTLSINGSCGSAEVTYLVDVTTINDQVITGESVCEGDSIELHAYGGDSYSWTPNTNMSDTGTSSPTVLVTGNNVFGVEIMRNGCSKHRTIEVNSVPVNPQEFPKEYLINYGDRQEIELDGAYEYEWTPSTYLSCTDCAYNISDAEEDITYFVNYTDENNCSLLDSIKVKVIYELYVPNAFSPDDNGLNDIFYAYSHKIEEFQIDIFNRWGEKIFTSNDINKGWDGTYQGRDAQIETYVWKISYVKVHTSKRIDKTGTVTLVR